MDKPVRIGICIAAAAISLALLPSLISAKSIEVPSAIYGSFGRGKFSRSNALSATNLAAKLGWLNKHQSGWKANLSTPPSSTAWISLDAANQKAALTLTLWPGAEFPGWEKAVIVSGAGKPIGIQRFSEDELAPLFRIVR
jgi:hypothetical protein